MFHRSFAVALVLGALFALLPGSAPAQQNGGGIEGSPRVFFDCNSRNCNRQYFRTEIDWVNWVRDPQDADVYMIMTSQGTGAGGREYQIDLSGREQYEGYEDQVLYSTLSTDTEREELDGITQALGLALAQFANASGFRNVVALEGLGGGGGGGAGGGIVGPGQVDDPWNLWVFRVNVNGDLESESTREEVQFRGGFNASRVTPTWKTNFNSDVNFERIEQELSSGETFIDERTDWSLNGRVVYSLAEHWSVGFNSRVGTNSNRNQDFMAQINPAVEYSYFPYPEATRRALTWYYEIGPVFRDYDQVTIFNETEQLLAEQALTVEFSQRQQWGDARVRLRGSSYLHNFDRNNVEVRGNLGYRIVRGLDLNVGASYARVHDQIYLSGAGLTDEERLLELEQEATDFEASIFVGLSYQFGSIFNNVVNNRFPGGRRF